MARNRRLLLIPYSGDGNVVVDITSIVDGGSIASGTYVLAPASVPSYRVSVVGLPEDSGFSIAATEDGIVLTDEQTFSPEWTGPTGAWTSSAFDGREGDTDGMYVIFSQATTPEAAVTVTVDGNKSVKSLSFMAADTCYTLKGDRIATEEGITVNGAAPVVISNELAISGTVALNAGTEITLATPRVTLASSALSGSGSLVLDPGEGNEFTMSTAHTSYTGEAVIKSGTVKMGDATSFGPLGRASYIRVKGGAKLSTGCNNGAVEGETNRLILEENATYTSYSSVSDVKLFPISHLELSGNANIVADVANVGITKHYNDPLTIAMNGYTLTKTGGNTLYIAAATFTGGGMLYISEGTLNLDSGYFATPQDETTFTNGTLNVATGAIVHFNKYMRDATLSVKNMILNGSVTRQTSNGTSTLTVTGYITGTGTTPMLTLANGAVIKPSTTGTRKYLTITESLTYDDKVTIDISDVDFSNYVSVPLFKVGSAEMLPESSAIAFVGTIPDGWELSKSPDGLGYRLRKPIGLAIKLR